MSEQLRWKVLTTVLGAGSAIATRNLVAGLWSSFSDTPAPVNPADRRASWQQAAAWGVLAGMGAGLARVVGERAAAGIWDRTTGGDPPGLST